jgi:diguanylate cyclase (GGDEF)-like protein
MIRGVKLRLLVLSSALVGSAALATNVGGLAAAGLTGVWAVNIGWTLGGIVALAGTVAAALQVERSRVGWAWRVWAAAIALWLVGVLVVDVLTVLGVSFWLYAEVLWTLAALVSIAGLAMRSAPGWLSFRLFVLDALPVAFLAAGIGLALVGGTARAGLWVLLLVPSVIYAVLPIISVQIVVWSASRAINMYLISGGFSLAAVAGIAWPIHARASVPQAHWSSALLTLGLLLVAVAGFRRATQPRRYTVLHPLEREHAARSVPGAAAVLVLIAAAGTVGGHFLALALAAAAAFALRSYLVRQTNVEAQSRLARLVTLDPLTALLNRRGLQNALVREHDRSKRDGSESPVALLVDLDDFKLVNVRLGYGAGDIVLRDVGRVLQASVRTTDYAARIGGDEFLVLMPGSSPAEGVRVAERIRHGISSLVFSSLSEEVRVTASVGVVAVPPGTPSFDDLVTLADTVLRESKQAGKNRSSVPDSDFSCAAPSFVDELRYGGRLRAVVQPIVRLADGRLWGYELLSRSTIDGYELPGDFFPLCDRAGRLRAVDYDCFRTCVEAADWLDESLRYYVNLFPATLLDVSVERIAGALPDDRAHRRCCIELSEQQIVGDPSYLLEPVRALKEAGFLIAVDDIGFGRSSLERLLLLEPEIVKIDRALIHGVAQDPWKRRALKRLLEVTRVLGAEVVAEGIESESDLAVLRRLGATFGQGYALGRPGELPSRDDRSGEPSLTGLAVGM